MIHTNRLDYTTNFMQWCPCWRAESCPADEEPCYGTRKFTTGMTEVRHQILFWARKPNLKTSCPVPRYPYRFSDYFSISLISAMSAMSLAQVIVSSSSSAAYRWSDYKLILCNFLCPSFLFDPPSFISPIFRMPIIYTLSQSQLS